MRHIDLNCDLGEGIGNDAAIMPWISSANIACGYHAGDEITMRDTIGLCIQHRVAIGAHPSFPDRQNFGRSESTASMEEVYEMVLTQIKLLDKIARQQEARLSHVKPHGALYNMSARNISLAATVARAVKDFDGQLILFGLSGSHSIMEAQRIGLKTASEVFADRTYQDDGSLSPRSIKGAMIEDVNTAVMQVVHMIRDGKVKTVSEKKITIAAETICVHGDGPRAVEFAQAIHQQLRQQGISIQPVSLQRNET